MILNWEICRAERKRPGGSSAHPVPLPAEFQKEWGTPEFLKKIQIHSPPPASEPESFFNKVVSSNSEHCRPDDDDEEVPVSENEFKSKTIESVGVFFFESPFFF